MNQLVPIILVGSLHPSAQQSNRWMYVGASSSGSKQCLCNQSVKDIGHLVIQLGTIANREEIFCRWFLWWCGVGVDLDWKLVHKTFDVVGDVHFHGVSLFLGINRFEGR
jgi:hypothetical protein